MVTKLRQELEIYKAQSPSTSTIQTPKAGSSRDLLSPPPRSQASSSQDGRDRGHGHAHGQGHRDRGGQRHGDDRRHDSRKGHGQGQGYQDQRGTGSQRDRDRDRNKDRERNKDKDNDKDKDKARDMDTPKDKASGLSIRGASGGGGAGSDFGPIRREDDRATKRRK
jgi:hypothetical protein